MFRLAGHLGYKHADDVAAALTPQQLIEWVAYWTIEPFGPEIPKDSIIPEKQSAEEIERDLFSMFL